MICFEFFKEPNASLLTHRQTLLRGGSGLASFLFNSIEFSHEQQDGGGLAVFGIKLESVVKFSARMGKKERLGLSSSTHSQGVHRPH